MRRKTLIQLVAIALSAAVLLSYGLHETHAQSTQVQIDCFDGVWVGSGSIARPIFRAWCGNGPLVEMTIRGGSAKAVFKIFAKGKARTGLRSYVIPLSGVIGSDGTLELTGYESNAKVDLSARNELGEGTWESRRLACYGSFQVQKKS